MIEFKYRPDVDGLRAVAVSMVLLFHAGLGFPGGYVGVDVFFVISGFLITGLILKEQEADTFKLSNFWVRRIRRIIPASTAMVLAVLVAGGFLLIPGDFEDLGKSMISQQLMLSNVYFWRNTGYFAGPGDLKPLLHTWSLAVEEQFYLVYPFLLVFLRRWPKWLMGAVLAAISVVSFAISQWGVNHHPDAAFFLLPTRAWELLVGGLIWFAPPPNSLKDWHLELLSWLAIAGILLSGWLFTASTPFPGATALLPCGSAALLIYTNSRRQTVVGRFLAMPPIVFIGLLSYSLYLWHWPILAFCRYRSEESIGIAGGTAAIAVSFVFAYLSWRFIETPFRTRTVLKTRLGLVSAAISVAFMLLVASTVVIWTEGLPVRFRKETQRIFATMEQVEFRHEVPVADVLSDKLPRFGATDRIPRILVWGDSHAMALVPVLDEICRQHGLAGVMATHGGTLPLVKFPNNREWAASEDFADAVIGYIVRNKIEFVVLAGYWHRDANNRLFVPCVRQTVDTLLSKGISVIVVRDVADQQQSPPKAILNAMRKGTDLGKLGVSLQEHYELQANADATLISLAHERVLVLNPAPYLTDAEGRCRIILDGDCLYWESNHITMAGARRLTPMFEQAFGELGLRMDDDTAKTVEEPGQ